MNRRLLIALLIALFAIAIGCVGLDAQARSQPGAEPCDQAFKHGAAAVLDAQQKLLQQKVEDMDAAVTPALKGQIAAFKDALAEATDAILRCEPADAPALQLQKDVAGRFHANQPQQAGTDSRYGAELKVTVSAPLTAAATAHR